MLGESETFKQYVKSERSLVPVPVMSQLSDLPEPRNAETDDAEYCTRLEILLILQSTTLVGLSS